MPLPPPAHSGGMSYPVNTAPVTVPGVPAGATPTVTTVSAVTQEDDDDDY